MTRCINLINIFYSLAMLAVFVMDGHWFPLCIGICMLHLSLGESDRAPDWWVWGMKKVFPFLR